MRKLFLFAAAMLCSVTMVFGDEVYQGKIGDFVWSINLTQKEAMLMPAIAYEGATGDEKYTGAIVIPDKVTYLSKDYPVTQIYVGVFAVNEYYQNAVTTVTIPASVKKIGAAAFAVEKGYTQTLTKIICQATTPPDMEEFVFDGLDMKKVTLETPTGTIDAYKAADGWKYFWVKTIYLNANIWYTANPVFFVHAWNTTVDKNVQMTQVKDSLYTADIPVDMTDVLFARMQTGATELKWKKSEGLWNRTCNLTLPADNDCFIVSNWDKGGCTFDEGTADEIKGSGGGWVDHNASWYLTGNAAVMTAAGLSVSEWTSNAIKVIGVYTELNNLKKNTEYKFKVTNGTWDDALGFDKVNTTLSSTGVLGDADNNICFTPAADGYLHVFKSSETGELQITFYETLPSDIQSVQTSDNGAQKIFRNGQLYILRDGVMYNLQGAVVE